MRPTPISRECAIGRVPFGLIPVTPAIAATTTARPSQTSQFILIGTTRSKPGELSRGSTPDQHPFRGSRVRLKRSERVFVRSKSPDDLRPASVKSRRACLALRCSSHLSRELLSFASNVLIRDDDRGSTRDACFIPGCRVGLKTSERVIFGSEALTI